MLLEVVVDQPGTRRGHCDHVCVQEDFTRIQPTNVKYAMNLADRTLVALDDFVLMPFPLGGIHANVNVVNVSDASMR